MLFRFLLIVPFAGSVFLTSGKLVNATNTPKYYFVVLSLLAITAFVAVSQKRITLVFSNKTTFWGISIICFLQACYGLIQFEGWLPSNHSKFAITGSFDNPAGFAAILAMGFPIGLYLLAKSKKVERYLSVIILAVVAIAVFLSNSRTGILAIIISLVVFSICRTKIANRFSQLRYRKLLATFIIVCTVVGVFILYNQKKDSANGRFLIWKVSSRMINDKPICGHGHGAFQAKYMDYQAEYFKNNTDSKYAQLADNVKHPFNEFMKVAVEFGIAGLTVILSFVLFILWKLIKSENENKTLVLSGLSSFFILACFSYPLQYVAVWLLGAFYLAALLPLKEIHIKNTPALIVTRGVIVIVCVYFLFYTCCQISAEIKWKTIAINSLRGNTEKMLPEYEKLYSSSLKHNPYFLYNYGAELNYMGKFDNSIDVLTECRKRFDDYDLQLLMADNYHKKGELGKAIQIYQHASNMAPCRFIPFYQIFEIYKSIGQMDMASVYANKIINKKVKIPSGSVSYFQNEAKTFLNEIKP